MKSCLALVCGVASAAAVFGSTGAFAQTLPVTPPTSPLGQTGSVAPPSVSAPVLPTAALDVPDNYRLNVEDTISIEVARHGDVSRAFRIPVDGRVRLLRLNTPLTVVGKTCAEIADELTQRLQTEGKLRLRPGQVSVFVVAMRPRRVYMRGNMISNREIDLKSGWRISELVAEIGGVPQADRVLVARVQNPDKNLRPTPVTIDLAQALNHPDSPENITLLEGDTFYLQGPQVKRLIVEGEGPRGVREWDERFGLRTTLVQMGYSTNGAGGDIHKAILWHVSKPGDPTSPRTAEPVDLDKLLNDKKSPDYAYNDMDTLEIPISQKYVFLQGAVGGPKKWYMPEDKKTYLADVMQWGTFGNSKIGDVKLRHYSDDDQILLSEKSYDYGKFQSNGDQKNNPEIHAHDMVYVPNVKRTDPNAVAGGIFTGWSLFNIFKAIAP